MDDKQNLDNLHKKAEHANVSEIRVQEFMSNVALEIAPDSHIHSVIQALAVKKISGAPVVDKSRKLLGMISEFDLLLQAATKDLAAVITFTTSVVTVTPETTLKDCLVILYTKKFRQIPVIDKNHRVVGIVTRLDVLQRLIKPLKKK